MVKAKPKAKKKVKKAAPTTARTGVSKSDAFYIEAYFGRKDAEALAADLQTNVEAVQNYIDDLKRIGFETPTNMPPRSAIEKAGFTEDNGVVCATQTSSMLADELAGTSPYATRPNPYMNDKFFNARLKDDVIITKRK